MNLNLDQGFLTHMIYGHMFVISSPPYFCSYNFDDLYMWLTKGFIWSWGPDHLRRHSPKIRGSHGLGQKMENRLR